MNILSIKHYIIIRFYCFNMNRTDEQLFDYNLLHYAVNIFKKYTLKSLENQTNKNFEIVFMIHNKIDINHMAIQELYNIQSNLKINIIRLNDINNFIKENSNDCDFFITTRIDHDDLIYNNAVEEIQSKCDIKIPFYFEGYVNGITMINNDYKNSCKFYSKYNDEFGSMSIFQSLIINKKILPNCINNVYLGSHTEVSNNIEKMCKNLNITFYKKYANVNKLEDSYIYIKHDFNHSSLINPSLNNNWHRTDIKVDKPKEWFIERFGNFID